VKKVMHEKTVQDLAADLSKGKTFLKITRRK